MRFERFRKIVSLRFIALMLSQKLKLFDCFDAFRDDVEPKGVPHGDNGFNNCLVVRVVRNVPYKRTVDFDCIKRQVLEVGKGRITGTKIVD